MIDPNGILTRDQLFELVWTKPIAQVAKESGIKSAAVLKACKVLGVPRPTTGHWVKIEHGQAPSRPALSPALDGATASITLGKFMARRKRTPKVEPPASTPSAPEAESIKWHFAVQKTRAALRGGPVDRTYGTIHPKPEHAHLGISVTRGSLDRALHLLNRLAWMLEEHEFNFTMPEKGHWQIKLVYSATGTELAFLIKEDVERYERELKPDEKDKDPIYIWDRWRHRETGRLRLLISEYHPEGARKSWGDGKNTKLEDKLADAAPGFVICAQGKHAQELEWAERQRRWDEEARLRREEEDRKRKEDERRGVLLAAAKIWSAAEELKAFRAACEGRLRNTSPEGALTELQKNWLEWVDHVIAETNPLSAGFLKHLEQPVIG